MAEARSVLDDEDYLSPKHWLIGVASGVSRLGLEVVCPGPTEGGAPAR